jgi:hypothetical protein
MKAEERKEKEDLEAEERSSPSGVIVYKAVLKEGLDELDRPSSALFWSGLAAGLSMSASLIAEGLLSSRLPESQWKPLITKLGYCVGFVVVILGRQQLFTENTLTPILPLMRDKTLHRFANVMRLWAIVLLANLLGSLGAAWVAHFKSSPALLRPCSSVELRELVKNSSPVPSTNIVNVRPTRSLRSIAPPFPKPSWKASSSAMSEARSLAPTAGALDVSNKLIVEQFFSTRSATSTPTPSPSSFGFFRNDASSAWAGTKQCPSMYGFWRRPIGIWKRPSQNANFARTYSTD